jgi:hypothetical protein
MVSSLHRIMDEVEVEMGSVMHRCASIAAVIGLALGVAACAADDKDSGRNVSSSPIGGAGSGAGGTPSAGTGGVGSTAGTGGVHATGTGGATMIAGTGGTTMRAGTGGMMTMMTPGTGGMMPMMMAGTGGMMMMVGTGGRSGSGGAAASGTGGTSAPATDLDGLRQACVDYINMYRAMVGKAPLKRATPAQEECSDMGAKQDGDSGQAHSSAGSCPGLGAQNACPGYPVGSGDIASVEKSLKGCLDQMWMEGEPPEPVPQCIQDYQTCFLKYGHWINMTDDSNSVVSCGFYKMPNGNYWMNQDFGR